MSRIQRIIEAKRKQGLSETGHGARNGRMEERSNARSGISGLFQRLTMAQINAPTMEVNRILPAVQDRAAVTAYKILRTRVLQGLRSHGWKTLVVTSAGPGEGKTLTACNLAVSISHDVNQSVVLIDLDLQRPSIAEYFGLDVNADVGDYLKGEAKIEDVLYRPEGLERLVIIPTARPVPNSSELLASPRMRSLVDWVRSQGSDTLTVFDMPPVLACDDVLAFLPHSDALLMIASEGITDRASLSRSMEMLGDCNLVGVVLNRSRERNSVSAYY